MTDWQKAREAASDAVAAVGVGYGGRTEDAVDAALSAFEKAGFVLVPKTLPDAWMAQILRGWAYKPYTGPESGAAYWSGLKQWDAEKAQNAHDAMIAAALEERK